MLYSRGEYVKLGCSSIWYGPEDNNFLPVRYSYLSILPDDKAGFFSIFPKAVLCFIMSSFSPIAMITFYILSKKLSSKRKKWYDIKIVPLTLQKYDFAAHFCKAS